MENGAADSSALEKDVNYRPGRNKTSRRAVHVISLLPLSVPVEEGNSTREGDFFRISYESGGYLAYRHFQERNPVIVKELENLRCDLELTFEMMDTEFSPLTASRHLQRTHVRENAKRRPTAIVGAAFSSVSAALGNLGGALEIPQVAVTSTSSTLDNKDSYPYFSRVIPTNLGDTQAMALYYNKIGVRHIGCLFVRDEFGSNFHRDVLVSAQQQNITVTSIAFEAESQDSIEDALVYLKRTGLRYFFGIWNQKTMEAVFTKGYELGIIGHEGYVWLLGEGSLFTDPTRTLNATQSKLAEAISGTGVVQLSIKDNPKIDEEMKRFKEDEEFREGFINAHNEEHRYIFDKIDLGNKSITQTAFQYLSYDAMMSVVLAACKQTDRNFTGEQLLKVIRSQSFEGASGFVDMNSTTGTRISSGLPYTITNLAIDWSRTTSDTFYFQINPSAEVDYQKQSVVQVEKSSFIYAGGSTTQPKSLPSVEEDMKLITTPIQGFGLGLACLVMVMSVGWAIFVFIYRKRSVIKAGQPAFLQMLCFGTLLLGASIIPMSLQEPISEYGLHVACMSSIWLLSIGFVTAFSALFCKLWRLNKVMRKSKSFRRVKVQAQDAIYPFAILLTLNVIVLSTWTATTPLKWRRVPLKSVDHFGRTLESYGTCSGENEIVFYVILLVINLSAVVFANLQSYQARNHPTEFNESFYISIAMASQLEACVLGAPVLFLVRESPTALFLIKSILVSVVGMGILLLLFVPKCLLRNTRIGKSTRVVSRSFRERSMFTSRTQDSGMMLVRKRPDRDDIDAAAKNIVAREAYSAAVSTSSHFVKDDPLGKASDARVRFVPNHPSAYLKGKKWTDPETEQQVRGELWA